MATIEDNIIYSIKKNGYPQKAVTLPFQSIFKVCKSNGISISDVLHKLEAQDVKSRIEGDKILFFNKETPEIPKEKPLFDFSDPKIADAMKKIQEMDPVELEKLKKQVEDMSPEERDALLKKAKDLFQEPSS
ncbi:hypothetical protein KJ966_02975 [bacterium]|nr:hypothetical protein [bacterium]